MQASTLVTVPIALWLTHAACAFFALACADPDELEPARAYPQAGLYTPGNTLGASDPTDRPKPASTLGARCKPFAEPAADGGVDSSSGSLRVQYTTQPTRGKYTPRNCGASWIESADGRYVTTLEIRAALRRPALVYLHEHACEDQPGPDVMTAATSANHDKPHNLTWSGKDFAGVLVPDGMYRLFIENTETDKAPGVFAVFEFEKSSKPFSVQPALDPDAALSSLTITWQPRPEVGRAR